MSRWFVFGVATAWGWAVRVNPPVRWPVAFDALDVPPAWIGGAS